MPAAFVRASGSSQYANRGAGAFTRSVSSNAVSGLSLTRFNLSSSARLISRGLSSSSSVTTSGGLAHSRVKQFSPQHASCKSWSVREPTQAEARFVESVQRATGASSAKGPLVAKKLSSGNVASASSSKGGSGATGGASSNDNGKSPPPHALPVAGEKYQRRQTKSLFANRKFLKSYPGALEMEVPVDNVLLDCRLLQTIGGETAGETRKRAQAYQGCLLAISTAQLEAAKQRTKLTVEALLNAVKKQESVLWRVVTWNTVFGLRDESVQLLSEEERQVAFLQTHYGVGPKKATKYHEAGLRTTEDLATSELVEKATRMGARYHADIITYIPRTESAEWHKRISGVVKQTNSGLQWELVGSYRRGVPLSSDLDVICWHPEIDTLSGHEQRIKELLNAFVDGLMSKGLVAEPLAHGARLWRGLARAPSDTEGVLNPARRIDINFTINPAFAMLSKTGNTALMVALRQRAIDMGMKLNEYGLWPSEVKVSKTDATATKAEIGKPPSDTLPEWGLLQATSEQEVFAFLHLTYLEPEQRRDENYRKWLDAQPVPRHDKA